MTGRRSRSPPVDRPRRTDPPARRTVTTATARSGPREDGARRHQDRISTSAGGHMSDHSLDRRPDNPGNAKQRGGGRGCLLPCRRQTRRDLGTLRGVLGRAGIYRDPTERRDVTKLDRKSTRLNSSHGSISYAVFCLKKKK